MKSRVAARIRALPPYLFAHIDELKQEQKAKGVDLIDLGIGDPDLPTPRHIVEALREAAPRPEHHRYPSYAGMLELRRAAASFYRDRFGVELDPASEVVALIGSKEGIAHLPVALVDPGDVVLCPDPGYPVYATGTRFVGGEPYSMVLRRERGFLPDLGAIPADVLARAKVMWVNYPNNPTAALAPRAFYEEVVAFAKRHDIIVASGGNTSPYRRWHTDKVIRQGDLMIVDINAIGPGGYFVDFVRCFKVAAKPTQQEKDLYKETYDNLYAAIGEVKPGATTADVAAKFPYYDDDKYGSVSIQQAAHSIGLTLYEGMWISRAYSLDYPAEIKQNMTFAIETFAGKPNLEMTTRLEENIVVTDTGVELLTRCQFEEDFFA